MTAPHRLPKTPWLSGYSDCTLVNPLCPGDLCVLWYGHKGMSEGKHLLSTMPGSAARPSDERDTSYPADDPESYVNEVDMDVMFLAPQGTTEEELIQLGCDKADELWPDPDRTDKPKPKEMFRSV